MARKPVVIRPYDEVETDLNAAKARYNDAREQRDAAYAAFPDPDCDAAYNAYNTMQYQIVDPAWAQVRALATELTRAHVSQVRAYESRYGIEY